jgi:hypothetical protein
MPFPLPVRGVDELSHETSLPAGAVRSMTNVDVGRAGAIRLRPGFVRSVTASAHSIRYLPQRGITLVGGGSGLYQLNTTGMTTTLVSLLNSPHPLEYTEYNGHVYASNRTTLVWLPEGATTWRSVGVTVPDAPTVSASATGDLLPGRYGITITNIDDRGEESGSATVQFVDLPNGGGISLSGLPITSGSVAIYLTAPNDENLRVSETVPAVFSTYLASLYPKGRPLETFSMVPLPPGDFIRWHNGRLYTASIDTLRWTEALRAHVHDASANLMRFSGYISFIEPVVDGIYVGDSRGVWFLKGGDPDEFNPVRVSPCRAVARSSTLVPPEHFNPKQVQTPYPCAVWLSTSGYVVGMAGGTAIELHADRVRVPGGLVGRSLFFYSEGRKQIVTPVNSNVTASYGLAVDSTYTP